jgi:membrane-bound lytic murein transglycosylase D
MKLPITIAVAMVMLLVVSLQANNLTSPDADPWLSANQSIIKERLKQLRLPLSIQQPDQVIDYIRDYALVGTTETSTMLGRSEFYLPIFEHYLSIYQLPQELKYLPTVESGLKNESHSGAGAKGLWQLMEITARQYQLSISPDYDERLDPYRATEAAVRILSDLFDQYQDWQLTIAAYNSGVGRVNKAIKAAGCTNYAEVSLHLPRETQRYVPAFIAAAYIHKHYSDHHITIVPFINYDVRTFSINQPISLAKVASITGTSLPLIKKLNPAFPTGMINPAKKSHFLVIPASTAAPFRNWLAKQPGYNHSMHAPKGFYHTTYAVAPGDNIEAIAKRFQCSTEDVLQWNNLKTRELANRQELNIYISKEFLMRRV